MNAVFWSIVTLLGDPPLLSLAVLGMTALYFLLGRSRPVGKEKAETRRMLKRFLLLIIPALLISFVGTEALKLVFQVPRPCIPCPVSGCNPYCPKTFAFPSGHTATITGVVTALVLLLRKRKYLLLYSLPVLVGVSRMALGVHTLNDVIAGFIFGSLATMVVWKFRKRLYKWEDKVL